MQRYYSNGKLLLTAEYLILDGAKGLALPSKFGQDLVVHSLDQNRVEWESLDRQGKSWFSGSFSLPSLEYALVEGSVEIAETLVRILRTAQKLNPGFLSGENGYRIRTHLGFDRNWGLGSSSTLISNIAYWSDTDPYALLFESFGGSGYDIACARHKGPLLYSLKQMQPQVEGVRFQPDFADRLYFVFLNRKQSSRDSIKNYRAQGPRAAEHIERVSDITQLMLTCGSLEEFAALLKAHEELLAGLLGRRTVQELLFSDYFGQTKSLGAWGGDFLLATGNEETPAYFSGKGFKTVIPYKEMVL